MTAHNHALAAFALAATPLLSANAQTGGETSTTIPLGEFGDAPDDTHTTYPRGGASIGMFPRAFNTPYCRLDPNGPAAYAVSAEDIRLGSAAFHERGVADAADPDGTPNLTDDDAHDHGARLSQKEDGGLALQIVVANRHAVLRKVSLNVLMDLERSGSWEHSTPFPEHMVRNVPVYEPAKRRTKVLLDRPLGGAELLTTWTRFAATDTEVSTDALGWNGCGVFAQGEIEDYLLSISNVTAFDFATAKAAAFALSLADVSVEASGSVAADASAVATALDSISADVSAAATAMDAASVSGKGHVSATAKAKAAAEASASAASASVKAAASAEAAAKQATRVVANASAAAIASAAATAC